MDGILIIDKPAGITSHDVVARCRRILKTKRIGHTGTLDPFATGVMVILVGKATRLAQFLDKSRKEYLATMRFGFETDTGDLTGTPKSEIEASKIFSDEELKNALTDHIGYIWQKPPMYSAKKVDGKKLYELARKGIEIERKSVCVGIFAIETVPDENGKLYFFQDDGTFDLKIRVVCGAGTYIRTLAETIAKKLGASAHLSALRRTGAGEFNISKAVTLEKLEEIVGENKLTDVLVSMNDALAHLMEIKLSDDEVRKTQNGIGLEYKSSEIKDEEVFRMIDENNNLAAIGFYNLEKNVIQPRIVLV